jgi:predicted DsbA family dithiol-disulfide isomerase
VEANDPAPVCTGDSCTTSFGAAAAATKKVHPKARTIAVEVFSDFVCPWCPIGKSRLDKAIALLGPDLSVKVTWRPYELNPGLPKEGVDRRAYLAAKFGSLESYERMSAHVVAAAASEGIPFRLDRIERTASTRDAHRLAWLAQKLGLQERLVPALFRAYFTDGENLGDPAVLARIGAEAGLDEGRVDALLAGDEGLAEVLAEEKRAFRLGIDGVPCFVVDGRPVLSGAQPPEVIAAALRDAAGA